MSKNRAICSDDRILNKFFDFLQSSTCGLPVIVDGHVFKNLLQEKPLTNHPTFVVSAKYKSENIIHPRIAKFLKDKMAPKIGIGSVHYFGSAIEAVNAVNDYTHAYIFGEQALYLETFGSIKTISALIIDEACQGHGTYPEIVELFKKVEHVSGKGYNKFTFTRSI